MVITKTMEVDAVLEDFDRVMLHPSWLGENLLYFMPSAGPDPPAGIGNPSGPTKESRSSGPKPWKARDEALVSHAA